MKLVFVLKTILPADFFTGHTTETFTVMVASLSTDIRPVSRACGSGLEPG